ncbi:MAG: 50S ribosomal protein L32e [Candidatus Hermodarchaeota archaeon]
MKQKRMIELRQEMNKRRPSFRRVESWRYKRVKDSWRKARGIDSQTRKKEKSGVKSPSIGYRGPKKVRGLHPSGYEEIRVHNIDDMKSLNNKKHAIKVSTKLGVKKRISVIDYAQSKGFKVLNLGISQSEMEHLESALESSITDLEDEELLEDED